MPNVNLGFEPWDLAEYIWPLIGILLIVEWLRWCRLSFKTPNTAAWTRFSLRLLLGAGALVTVAAWFARWPHRNDARTMTAGLFGVAALAILWVVRSYRSSTRPIGRAERTILTLFRCLAILGILVFIARPVLRWSRIIEERNTILVLLDDSRSMGIRDAHSGDDQPIQTRMERLRGILMENEVTLDRLRLVQDVQIANFDTELRYTGTSDLKAGGRYTALAQAVHNAWAQAVQTGRRVTGVLLLSDGGENFSAINPLTAADELAHAGVALWAVGMGSELPIGQNRSLIARRLNAPPRVSVLNQFTLQGEYLTLGLAEREIQVELYYDDEKVASKTIRPSAPREVLTTSFDYTPTSAGLHKLTLKATAPDLDPDRRTAALSQFIQVTQEFLNVLYIDRPRYERAAIARAIEPAREIRLTKGQAGMANGVLFNHLPRKPEEWLNFDAFILGDVPPGSIYKSQYEAIRDCVSKNGRGLLILGGARSLGGGAYAHTPIAEVLPIDAAAVSHRDAEIKVQPTLVGQKHPIIQLTGMATASTPATAPAWPTLPPIAGLDLARQLKPAAQVLLATTKGEPVLLAQEAGTGRSAVLTIDSTWQWAMQLDRGDEFHKRFWRQMILWLANRKPAVWVNTNQPRYQLPKVNAGAEIVIAEAGLASFTDEQAPRKMELTGKLIAADQTSQPLSFIRKGENYETRPKISKDGEYQIEVSAIVDGVKTDPARTAFLVESPDIEMTAATANYDLLRQMAARTESAGGEFVTAEHAGELMERILARQQPTRRTVTESSNVLDGARLPLLWLILAMLILEWAIRKARGLV